MCSVNRGETAPCLACVQNNKFLAHLFVHHSLSRCSFLMEASSFNGVINSVGCNLIPLNSFVNVHICEMKYVNFGHLNDLLS
jgi:hypothetical protein